MSPSGFFIRSLFTLGLGQILTWVSGITLTVMMPRYLGDAGLGKFTFGFALVSLFGLIADLGTATYLTKEIARAPSRATALSINAIALRLPLVVIACLGAIVAVQVFDTDPVKQSVVYVLCIGLFVNAVGSVIGGALQGLKLMRALTVAMVAGRFGYAGIAAVLLLRGGGPVDVAIAWAISVAIGTVISVIALMRVAPVTARLEASLSRQLLLGGLPFFISQAGLLVYGSIDSVLLAIMTRDAVVGWYAAAIRMISIPVFLPTIVCTVVFPMLAASVANSVTFYAVTRKAIHLVIFLSLPIGVGIVVLADKLIAFFGYPADFINSLVPTMVLAAGVPLIAIDMVLGVVIASYDRQRQWAFAGIAAAILNPILNLIAIPWTQAVYSNGAIGAAVTTDLTEVFIMVMGLRLLPSGIINASLVGGIVRCLVAALPMAGAVSLVRDWPLPVAVIVGALVYFVSSLAIGAVSFADIREVRSQLLHRQRVASATAL